jgi:hypothetical protein
VVNVGTFPVKAYRVNKELLCDSSGLFRAALGPEWVEEKTGVLNRPDDDADAFNTYLNWVYRGKISLDFDKDDEQTNTAAIWSHAIFAYELGGKLRDISFKDAITDAVAQMMSIKRSDGEEWMPTSKLLLDLAYKKLPCDSKLNLLVVHKLTRASNASELIKGSHPADFLLNVSQELLRKAFYNESTENAAARCAFHEHAPGACYRGMRS